MATWALVMAGVPQRSVIGRLLFLIYLNDITHAVKHCQIKMFAGDTSLFTGIDDRVGAANKINSDLTAISHLAKTSVPTNVQSLLIRVSDNLSQGFRMDEYQPIYMDGRVLTKVTHPKHVGVTISR